MPNRAAALRSRAAVSGRRSEPERVARQRRQRETMIGRRDRNELGNRPVVRPRRSRSRAGISCLQAFRYRRELIVPAVADDDDLHWRRPGRIRAGREIRIGGCVSGIVTADDVVDRVGNVACIVHDRAGIVGETDVVGPMSSSGLSPSVSLNDVRVKIRAFRFHQVSW